MISIFYICVNAPLRVFSCAYTGDRGQFVLKGIDHRRKQCSVLKGMAELQDQSDEAKTECLLLRAENITHSRNIDDTAVL